MIKIYDVKTELKGCDNWKVSFKVPETVNNKPKPEDYYNYVSFIIY